MAPSFLKPPGAIKDRKTLGTTGLIQLCSSGSGGSGVAGRRMGVMAGWDGQRTKARHKVEPLEESHYGY